MPTTDEALAAMRDARERLFAASQARDALVMGRQIVGGLAAVAALNTQIAQCRAELQAAREDVIAARAAG